MIWGKEAGRWQTFRLERCFSDDMINETQNNIKEMLDFSHFKSFKSGLGR